MIINFDEYKDGEPITIIEHGIRKTYTCPKVILSYNPCFPSNAIYLEIVGKNVVYEDSKVGDLNG